MIKYNNSQYANCASLLDRITQLVDSGIMDKMSLQKKVLLLHMLKTIEKYNKVLSKEKRHSFHVILNEMFASQNVTHR